VVDAADDVAQLLDHLEVSHCLTAGWSGGGPHALATAARLPDRVAGVAALSGFAPYDAAGLDFFDGMGQGNLDEFALAMQGEDALRTALEAEAAGMRMADGRGLRMGLAPMLAAVDRAFLTTAVADELASVVAEGLVHGASGWIDDDLAFLKPWGFFPEDVHVPAFIWQGGQDLMVPFAHGQWLADHIPGADAELDPGQGHMSLGLGDFSAVLDKLTKSL
jgi:pimeloyl-ACP methyl ester carboxylesterase